MARGYRGDPLRSAERFRPDPFGEGAMYRTGDRAKVREDGELMFLGRLDDQVKIDGQRVEPGEVERVLAEHPAILESAVLAREDMPGHKRLIAYAGSSSGAEPARRVLGAHRAKLPAFMAPAHSSGLTRCPATSAARWTESPCRAAAAAPASIWRSELAAVATILAEVLRLDARGADEDFFELGGTSLLAMRLAGRLRERLGMALDIRAVFERERPPRGAEP